MSLHAASDRRELESFRRKTPQKKENSIRSAAHFPVGYFPEGRLLDGSPGPTCPGDDVTEEAGHWVSAYLDPASSPWPPWLCDSEQSTEPPRGVGRVPPNLLVLQGD